MELYTTLEQQLKKEINFVTDNGELKKWVVLNKAQNFDEELIGLLLENEELKNKFFVNVKGTLVFNQNLFVQFLEQKNYLNDSYTQYKNKVGLTIDGKYLKQRNEVALVWPFKDCILEGGQSREEDKREEIFFNEILAQDEITQLLEPKVLTNAKRIDKDGEKQLDQFNRNENGTITDNLIIKGNNLLALHTLEEEFTGKVKLIYIDPPYNTGNDGFKYNDSFNHSTWLTFMKNRLEIAKKLLSQDGAIFVQCDDNEVHYLKILLDEVFEYNFINTITVKTKVGGVTGSSEGKSFKDSTEFINVFAKDKKHISFNPIFQLTPLYEYINSYLEEGKSWKYTSVITELEGKVKLKEIDGYCFYGYKKFKSKSVKTFSRDNNISEETTYKEYSDKIFRTTNAQSSVRQTVINETEGVDYPIISVEYFPIKGKNKGNKIEVFYKDEERNMLMFLSDMITEVDNEVFYKEKISTLWDDIQYNNLSKEGGVDFPNGKKPELLIKRIIELTTNEGDIVLDYHLGSGSTCAVAHKMGRQYVGIEQIDYGANDSVIRLNNVINGDQTGISKSVKWEQGGTFVCLELKKYNQIFIEQIEESKNSETLLKIWEQMKVKSFMNYNVDIKKQDENLDEFKALSLTEQKQHLCELLDKNQLYVNLSSLNDADFTCTEEEKKVTKDFYQLKK
jgi:adenine-specific DNA-methyltransferase